MTTAPPPDTRRYRARIAPGADSALLYEIVHPDGYVVASLALPAPDAPNEPDMALCPHIWAAALDMAEVLEKLARLAAEATLLDVYDLQLDAIELLGSIDRARLADLQEQSAWRRRKRG